MSRYLLAIDQGTTNSRAILFDQHGQLISQHELPLKQFFPNDGWVEQDPEEMYANTVECCRQAVKKAGVSTNEIIGVGITNQRETTIIWDRLTGKPIYQAIVWLDRRTSELCYQLSQTSLKQSVYDKTGLLLDPYFSATKIKWILENIPDAKERAAKGDLLFGTVDTYLLWKLTEGRTHATDATNASRTLLFNIHSQIWDPDLLAAFSVPKLLLPVVLDNTADFGMMDATVLGAQVPILSMAGDQQAATVGQACFEPGMVKVTYGTGCFMLLNTGETVLKSNNRLLSTIAYRINNQVIYGLEGSIFSAGVTVKWLRDALKMISSSAETETLAKSVASTGGVYLVPAFTGLGAPYWEPNARGALSGLTLNTRREHIVRAALETIGYQTRDLLNAMHADYQSPLTKIRVDGGMVANNWLMQFVADMLRLEVHKPVCIETTALGVAYLAGLQAGLYQSLDDIAKHWKMNSIFHPEMKQQDSEKLYEGWLRAVERVIH